MAEKCMNIHHTPPHVNAMESAPENIFSAQNEKNQKIHNFDPKEGRVIFSTFLTPTPIPLPTKVVSSGRGFGGGGGSGPTTHWGMRLDKIMILQGVKQTIQPLEEGYVDMPKKAQTGGGVCGVFPYI